ncbi:PREDICTED: condensin complex subunit 2 [Cyphomyrmex costatus]|uniref:Condensin complex subunit 2 n=1 Tax=Cyphomyrmex costatus TaxID=456900 RepID=A0A151IC28_9HYME|nr:PREDICTED: condensin complex subunit 2 [Cyphomyrmex costatus]KYM97351.1 Condensin complex subunit 2 [Cyphomyrmex costatus]
MDSRKSLIHKRLESLQNTPNSSSPLRRKSIVQTPPTNNLSENDDEAERIARRREIFTTPPSANGNNSSKRLSLGLGLLANIPVPQMAESINKCIQLNAENKINVKNAFSLEMIDFMTYMIKKQDANMSNLQVASTSLDVSTKIYGYRVDNVHMEILKMAGGLDKQVMENMEQNLEEQAEAVQEDAENVEVRKKKKKKSKQKIFSTVEALRGNIEIAKPMSTMIGEGDLQTSDMLYQAALPNHANSGFYQHPYNDVLVDVLEDKLQSQNNSDVKYVIPGIEDFLNLEICTSYSNFEFLDWSVENEPEQEIESNDDGEDRFQFDLDASVEHDDDPVPEPMNYFDIEHDDNENIQACFRKTIDRPVNIVEMPKNARASEYSFVQSSMSLHWAGPSHWKFWNFVKSSAAEGSTKVAYMQAKKKEKRKQFELVYDETRDIIDAKFASSQSIKLHAKTAKAEWSTENLTLPEDVHYDITQGSKLYLYKRLTIKSANSEKENENVVTVADISDGERYDYNNPNDTLEYCPNIEQEVYDDYGREDGNDDCNFDDSANVLDSQGLIGDNLVAAPKLVNKISIAYCLKAKKIDMRQLKKSLWTCLKSTNNAVIAEETLNETDTMKESKQFSDVYKTLPKLLTKNNAEALSVPISFISMLHLANEKELKICSVPDLSDIIIQPGSPSSN